MFATNMDIGNVIEHMILREHMILISSILIA